MTRTLSPELTAATTRERAAEAVCHLLTIASRQRYEAAVRASGPLAYWRFGEAPGTLTTWDEIGQHNGTVGGGASVGTAVSAPDGDGAASFDGVSGQIVVPYSPAFNVARFSLEFLVRATVPQPQAFGRLVSKLTPGTPPGWCTNVQDQTVDLTLRIDTSAGVNQLWIIPNVFDGTLHHVVWTVDPAAAAVGGYRDAVLTLSQTEVFDVGAGIAGNVNPLVFGREAGGAFPAWFAGVLDEVAFYDRILTPTEIAAHHTARTTPTIPTMRFTDHQPDVVARGRTYLSVPFAFTLPADSDDQPPQPRLGIANVDRRIVAAVRAVEVDAPVAISSVLVRAADPDVYEIAYPDMAMDRVTGSVTRLEADLSLSLATPRRYPRQRFLPSSHPALF